MLIPQIADERVVYNSIIIPLPSFPHVVVKYQIKHQKNGRNKMEN